MSTHLLRTVSVFATALVLASLAGAQNHPILESAASPQRSMGLDGPDSVNLFNGNLSLEVPIGQVYTLSETLAYQITLSYTSNGWVSLISEELPDPIDPPTGTDICEGAPGLPSPFAEPNPEWNAGFGWMVSLGNVFDPGAPLVNTTPQHIYRDPSGGMHYLFDTIHESDSEIDSVTFSRDGTYIRGQTEPGGATISFPNGTIHTFTAPDTGGKHRITGMQDRFGNWVNVAYTQWPGYPAGGQACGPGALCPWQQWVISDSGGRQHELWFHTPDIGSSGSRSEFPLQDPRYYLRYVHLAASENRLACYTFEYDVEGQARRPDYDTCRPNELTDVTYLEKIKIPDATTSQSCTEVAACADCSTWEFDYDQGAQGELATVTLPTDGTIDYGYDEYTFPGGTQNPWGGWLTILERRKGVTTRTRTDVGGTASTWTYLPEPQGGSARTVYRQVRDPEGNRTFHYFRTTALPEEFGSGWDYGLPTVGPDGPPGDPYLSRIEFDASFNELRRHYLRFEHDQLRLAGDIQPDPHPGPTIDGPGFSAVSRWWLNSNQRVVWRKTLYSDDFVVPPAVQAYTQTNFSDFDGFGHFRTTSFASNFTDDSSPWPDSSSRSRFVGYSPVLDDGTITYPQYAVNQVTNQMEPVAVPYIPWNDSREWIHGMFDRTDATFGSKDERTLFDFDPSTGFLRGMRRLRDNTVNNPQLDIHDVIVELERTPLIPSGHRVTSSTYGGDSQAIAANSASPFSPGGVLPASIRTVDYVSGTPSRSRYHTSTLGLSRQLVPEPFYVLDRDVDTATGLVLRERDTATYPVDFDYDLVGRPTTITPNPGGLDAPAWTRFQYITPSSTYGGMSAVQVDQLREGTQTVLSSAVSVADGFGRTSRTCSKLADGTWNRQVTRYDGLGRAHEVSEVEFDPEDACVSGSEPTVPLHWTRTEFDRYGRPTVVTPPDQVQDGADRTTAFDYAGARKVTSTSRIATTSDPNGTPVSRYHLFDGFGRLREVREPSGESGALVSTRYDHDVAGRLTHGWTTAEGVTQNRYWVYDGLGVLRSETHPEVDGVVTYTYDPVGRVIGRTLGPSELRYQYDASGRPTTTVYRENGGADQLLQEFLYYGVGPNDVPNPANQWAYAKLASATQHTRAGDFDSIVKQTYSYGTSVTGGNVSQVSTNVQVVDGSASAVVPARTFTTRYTYDPLGNLKNLTYPLAPGASPAAPTRVLVHNYQNGWLTSIVHGGTEQAGLDYHRNGMVSEITHGNGVVDGFAKDPFDIARARQLTTTGALDAQGLPADWDSGQFAFDPSGNVTEIGVNRFDYDQVGRLHTRYKLEASTCLRQRFAYDSFGNLIEVLDGPAAQCDWPIPNATEIPANPSTNRLGPDVPFDEEGNQLAYGTRQLTWDPLGRMASRRGNGASMVYFGYDTAGERLVSLVLEPSRKFTSYTMRDLDGRPLRSLSYHWEQEIMPPYSVTETYGWDHDELFIGRLAFASDWSGSMYSGMVHHHRNHLGTLQMLTNATGHVLERETDAFSPFGDSPTYFGEPLFFTGHERDPIDAMGGLDYMHARYYSAHYKRFLSPDPMGGDPASPQSWNRYAYVLNNPVLYVDPFGLAEQEERFRVNFEDEIVVHGEFIPWVLPPPVWDNPLYRIALMRLTSYLTADEETPGPVRPEFADMTFSYSEEPCSESWCRQGFVDCLGACMETADPLSGIHSALVPLSPGVPLSKSWVKALRLSRVFTVPGSSPTTTVGSVVSTRFGLGARSSLRMAGRAAAPVVLGYGLAMAGIEVYCGAQCAADPCTFGN